MNIKYGFLIGCIAVLLVAACSEDQIIKLPASSVSIEGYSDQNDTLVNEMEVLTDSIITVKLSATLSGQEAVANHFVSFAVDTSKMAFYRNKYGDALVLPSSSYFFVKSECQITKGSTLSDAMELNIVQETLLRPYATFVLPIVIESVDGRQDAVAPEEVMYLVFKAGKALFISKAEWTIVDATEMGEGIGVPESAIDNDETTYWQTGVTAGVAPPYFIEIDFATEVTFSAVSIAKIPPPYGSILKGQLEVSLDGITWTDLGTYEYTEQGDRLIETGIATARYMRINILDVAPLFGVYYPLYVSEITLIP